MVVSVNEYLHEPSPEMWLKINFRSTPARHSEFSIKLKLDFRILLIYLLLFM